ncbi:Ig-like domain-containing protein [Companilactobacillus halodurans]|uniref:SDR-like Ig domain-containing protein n=1 Tax=Companilactobacillus halodurans TaxID=2584183 RepID=A0A5P0ZZQ8_9LACO|nr:Ig-like domain-containing protein [Companilactobacillus halodurans]MQS98500.1 hypothetical protein [Companilactobacillus halodurans]
MKMKRSFLLITILTFFLTFLLLFIPNHPVLAETVSSSASTATTSPPGGTDDTATTNVSSVIPVTGLTVNDGTITDLNGKSVKPSDNLYFWLNYHVNYNWSIPDGIQVKSGDTANFKLPNSLVAYEDSSLPIYNSQGVVVGNATIKSDASNGTITFNDAFSTANTSRLGTLSILTKGTSWT